MTDWTPYLRSPSVRGDALAFAAEDDVWLTALPEPGAPAPRAWRLTADAAPVAGIRLSPDGAHVAFTSRRDGPPEVCVVATEPASEPARRLTWWGEATTRVIGWTGDGRVLAVTAAGRPFRDMTWAHAVPLDGGRAERLPWGPLTGYAAGPGGAVLLGVRQSARGAAAWKRYRGGTAGALWLDVAGTGTFTPFLRDLRGQLEDPAWVGGRAVFLSDHEGWANVYSVAVTNGGPQADLRRHTDHGDAYARSLAGDGSRLVYACRGDLWVLEGVESDSEPRRIGVRLGGGGGGRRPAPVRAADALGAVAADMTGRASAVEVRGTVHWVTHREGPARSLADDAGVRRRLPRVAAGPVVVAVSDAQGEDGLEVLPVDPATPPRVVAAGRLGRVLDVAVSPAGTLAAVASHDGRVLVVDLDSGRVREIDRSAGGDATGLAFAPDGRWLAWSHAGPAEALRQIRMAPVADDPAVAGEVVEVTQLRFSDTEPVFTPDGRHLAFLSTRTFDPVYDVHAFDMSFPTAIRPYVIPLAAATPSPFDPELDGRPPTAAPSGPAPSAPPSGASSSSASPSAPAPASAGGPDAAGGTATDSDTAPPPPVQVDLEGLATRAVPVPVAAGRLSRLHAARDALLWLERPLAGELGDALAPGADRPRPALRRYDLSTRRLTTLVEELDDVTVSGDGSLMVVRDGSALRVLPTDRPAKDAGEDGTVEVDLDRVRVTVDPVAMWHQMFDENGRLMRDHFWVADFAGVDWGGVLERYRPLVARLGSRDDLSELLWEVVGELGASHAYEIPPERPADSARALGHLGADLEPAADGTWRIARIVPGEPSVPAARSPLQAPGVAVRPDDVLLAVDGRPVDAVRGPGPLLVGAARTPVELTLARAGEGPRRVVVRPLPDERALRYHDWVAGTRRSVHDLGSGRVGYLHIPNMMAVGWAELHRDLHIEVARDALVVDVRHNGGGHLSELVLERLSRTVRAWDVARHRIPQPYPSDAPRGPLVAIADEWAGSDGDIVTAGFKALGLGPVVGQRTWGGVIGIDMRHGLVDGTAVSQPQYAFWFPEQQWGVENHGVDPDVPVAIAPQDWAAGRDPQLETAVRLALEALATTETPRPPDTATRPDRTPPVLPPRPQGPS